jgi:hypothetical protein
LFKWRITGTNAVGGKYSFVTKDGIPRLKLSNDGSSFPDSCASSVPTLTSFNIAQYAAPCKPSTNYVLTYMMETNYVSGDGTGAKMTVVMRDAVGSALGSEQGGNYIKTTTTRQKYSVSFTSDASTAFITLKTYVKSLSAPGTLIMDAYFDGITLTEATPAVRTQAVGRVAN